MCENRSMDYFRKTFNQVIELKIQEIIKEKMRKSGRLDTELDKPMVGTSRFERSSKPYQRNQGVFGASQVDEDDFNYDYSDQEDELI